MSTSSLAPVLVVGAGPVGLTAAHLLAARDVPVVVIERNAGTSDEAKAISIDDESLRAYAAAGIVDEILAIVVPGTGTVYFDRRDRRLLHASGPSPTQPRGFPFKNQFAQPELEALLLRTLRERPGVEVRFSTELTAFDEHEEGLTATVLSAVNGVERRIDASWVLGCDGGRSTVRELAGIAMTGKNHRDVWAVIDTVGDHHRERYGMHHGNPSRPTVVVPGRGGRCRYEFRQFEGETARGEKPSLETIRALLAPYRPIEADQIERCTAYTFNALVADRWRVGRSFLLGDAAHMMPPFAGQGLNSGVRDAANLAWKLAGVWHGQYGEQVLDTYQVERKAHAEATVRLSERLGSVVMTTSRARALARDLIVSTMMRTKRGRDYLSQMKFRPQSVHRDGGVVVAMDGERPSALLGREIPQPLVLVPPTLAPRRLDGVLGTGFGLIGVDVDEQDWDRVFAAFADGPPLRPVDVQLGDRLPRPSERYLSVADADGGLERAVGGERGRFVVVKPDRYVAAVFGAASATAVAAALRRRLALSNAAAAQRQVQPSAAANEY